MEWFPDAGRISMPWEYTDEYYREYTRTTWNESAEHYAPVMERFAPIWRDLVELLAPRPGERVLDLGTGPGEPAMTLAERVAPDGSVLGIDLSEKMIELARRAAAGHPERRTEFRVMDSSALDLPAGTFDAVVSSFGFQIFTDPAGAAREAHRVLAPSGRIAASVWSTGKEVPFLDVLIAPMLEHAEPDASGYIPTPYETGGPGEMVAFLEAAGFRSAREERRRYLFQFPDEAAYLHALLRGTPIGHSLAEEDEATQNEVLRKTRVNLRRWRGPDGLTLPAEVVFATAHA